MLKAGFFWIALEIGNNLFYGILFVCFINRLLTKKRDERVSLFICAGLIGGAYSAFLFVPEQSLKLYFSDSWVYIIVLVYSILFYKDSWWCKLLWFTILFSISSTSASLSYYLFSAVFQVAFEDLLNPGAIRIVFMAFSAASVFGLMFVTIHLYAPLKDHHFLSIRPVLIITLINIISVLTEEMMFRLYPEEVISPMIFFFICTQSLAICMLSLLLYRLIYDYSEQITSFKLQNQEREELTNRLAEINRLSDTIHQLRHDMTKQMDIVMNLVKRGRTDQAEKYLNDVKDELPAMFSTGSSSLDSALTIREKIMESQNITFLPELCDLSRLPMKEVDFCAIIMNLLDNAVEAQNRYRKEIPECFVKLEIRVVHEMLLIRCTNPCTTIPLKKIGTGFVSAKRESGKGLGIPIIESIVKENKGICDWKQSHGYFTAIISLPMDGN